MPGGLAAKAKASYNWPACARSSGDRAPVSGTGCRGFESLRAHQKFEGRFMSEKPLLVTAAIIRDGDRILIAQRLPDSFIEPSLWEFPGGKVEFTEDPIDCLKREIIEELGIEITVDEL